MILSLDPEGGPSGKGEPWTADQGDPSLGLAKALGKMGARLGRQVVASAERKGGRPANGGPILWAATGSGRTGAETAGRKFPFGEAGRSRC